MEIFQLRWPGVEHYNGCQIGRGCATNLHRKGNSRSVVAWGSVFTTMRRILNPSCGPHHPTRRGLGPIMSLGHWKQVRGDEQVRVLPANTGLVGAAGHHVGFCDRAVTGCLGNGCLSYVVDKKTENEKVDGHPSAPAPGVPTHPGLKPRRRMPIPPFGPPRRQIRLPSAPLRVASRRRSARRTWPADQVPQVPPNSSVEGSLFSPP